MSNLPAFRALLGNYRTDEKIALEFSLRDDLQKAFELLYGELKPCPFAPVGRNTIIVPKEAAEYFKGLHPKEVTVR